MVEALQQGVKIRRERGSDLGRFLSESTDIADGLLVV